jgi:hypothetical protein
VLDLPVPAGQVSFVKMRPADVVSCAPGRSLETAVLNVHVVDGALHWIA